MSITIKIKRCSNDCLEQNTFQEGEPILVNNYKLKYGLQTDMTVEHAGFAVGKTITSPLIPEYAGQSIGAVKVASEDQSTYVYMLGTLLKSVYKQVQNLSIQYATNDIKSLIGITDWMTYYSESSIYDKVHSIESDISLIKNDIGNNWNLINTYATSITDMIAIMCDASTSPVTHHISIDDEHRLTFISKRFIDFQKLDLYWNEEPGDYGSIFINASDLSTRACSLLNFSNIDIGGTSIMRIADVNTSTEGGGGNKYFIFGPNIIDQNSPIFYFGKNIESSANGNFIGSLFMIEDTTFNSYFINLKNVSSATSNLYILYDQDNVARKIKMNLPTSDSGLSAGDWWCDSGVVKIKT